MSAKQRRPLAEAQKHDRRERSGPRRINAYEKTMEFSRRDYLIEALEHRIATLERLAPDGRQPRILGPWESGYAESRSAAREFDEARWEIAKLRMQLEAENRWVAARKAPEDG